MKFLKSAFKRKKDPLTSEERIELVTKSSKQVGPGVFFSTIVVIASFLPVFMLTGMEGKLFHPLAWTQTFILIVDALVAITLTPVLISILFYSSSESKLSPPSSYSSSSDVEK